MNRIFALVAATGLSVALITPVVLAEEPAKPDRGKSLAETPVEEVVKDTRGGSLPRGGRENPTVEAGAVRWHENLAAARAASVKSGRPVLLFQLLGRLDQEFC